MKTIDMATIHDMIYMRIITIFKRLMFFSLGRQSSTIPS